MDPHLERINDGVNVIESTEGREKRSTFARSEKEKERPAICGQSTWNNQREREGANIGRGDESIELWCMLQIPSVLGSRLQFETERFRAYRVEKSRRCRSIRSVI
jgi:hypothetical protein